MELLSLLFSLIKAHKLKTAIVLVILGAIGFAIYRLSGDLHEKFTEEFIFELIRTYGYYLIFMLVMLGNMGVPVPEESPVIMAGYAAYKGLLDYKIAALVCIVSAIVGDNIGYLIGRKGGRKLILRYGKYVHIDDERLKKFEGFFTRYGDKTVFFARFIAGLRWLAGPLSGAAQMPFHKFMIFNALGAVVWVAIMTQLGYHFGSQLPRLLKILGRTNAAILITAAIILLVIYYLRKRRRDKAATGTATNN